METLLAVFDLLVVDQQNRIVTGLGKDDFEIAEDSVLQQAATFALEDGSSVPRSIVLIIDYSSSQTPYLSSSITAAQKLVEQLKPKDRMAIVTDDVALLVPFTEDRKRLKDTLESIRRRAFSAGAVGQSAQYSALFATLRELLTEEERPIIIFQTDGDQLRALRPMLPNLAYGWKPLLVEFSLEDLQKYADLTHTTIYSIYPGLRLIGLPPEEQLNRAVIMAEEVNRTDAARIRAKSLGRLTARPGLTAEQKQHALTGHLQQQLAMSWLAEQTGGWLEYLETPDQADVIYARILNSINKRYILGYYPTNTARDGRWRKVQIKVRAHPDYVVLGRDRYLVPAEEK
ncbi:MAG: VWA domain-containing protein [Acidobacteria bacterium]|nr:VWA domain-containing protein [Acidobacteriota bacterium]MBI3421321.1 VWA domain-containing protein [Acidobacteriota bacterium]